MDRESLLKLAEKLEEAFRECRVCRLTPTTTLRLATAARAQAAHPTRDDVARAICAVSGGCPNLCMTCIGKANLVKRLYTGAVWDRC